MLILKPCTGPSLILRPQDRPAYYPAATTEAAYVIVYWRVRRTDGTVDAWHEHDRIAPTAATTIHHNPNVDQLVDVALMPISASGVPGFASIEEAFAATAVYQREIEAPVISQVGVATQDLIILAIDGYTKFATKRRVRISDNAQMASAVETITDAGDQVLPRVLNVWRAGAAPSGAAINVAAAANGAVATASSNYDHNVVLSPEGAIDGQRVVGSQPYSAWHTDGSAFPQWLEVAFGGAKAISEIDLYLWAYAAGNDETTTSSSLMLLDFLVQTWDGTMWLTVPGGAVTGNDKVLRKFRFPAITTTKIRLFVTAATDAYVRLAEIEASHPAPPTLPQTIYVTVAHSGGGAFGAESAVQQFSFAGTNTAGTSGSGELVPRDNYEYGSL